MSSLKIDQYFAVAVNDGVRCGFPDNDVGQWSSSVAYWTILFNGAGVGSVVFSVVLRQFRGHISSCHSGLVKQFESTIFSADTYFNI